MANIYPPTYPQHHALDFHPRPVAHAPSPLGFGFGLGATTPGSLSLTPSSFASPHHQHSQRSQKRRLEIDEDDVARRGDDAMDRSPTPERPKRAGPKRLRVAATETPAKASDKDSINRESKSPSSDVDVGVLLASLPQQSLLPLMMALLREQPGLRPLVLSLLPRPTLETALQALAQASKTLRDAYPYSAPQSTSFVSGSSTGTFGAVRSQGTGFGTFGRAASQSSSPSTNVHNGGMRDSYIISRLRPHISEFVSACFSYLPYFSYLPPPAQAAPQQIQPMKPHAAETFTFLSTITSHLFSQPQLTQNEMSTLLMPRLLQEWGAWVDHVDEVVNRRGGMFSAEVVRGWEKSLDEFVEKDGGSMKDVRDRWVVKVGWLVGRRIVVNMDEDEEL